MTETIADLQKEIERERKLLLQYENMERLEEDPRRRMRLQENVKEAKQNILTYEVRIAQIRAESQPAVAIQQRESVFIANVPYGLETALFGREQELALLDDWFHRDADHPLLAVIGLGGQGKSSCKPTGWPRRWWCGGAFTSKTARCVPCCWHCFPMV